MISLIAPKRHSGNSFFFLPRFPNSGSRSSIVICYNINDVSGLRTVLSHTPITAYIDYGGCDYDGCDYGECEYGGCEYGECDYGGCEYGECDYGECDPNPNPYHNPYPYLPRYWSISVPPKNFCPPYECLSPPINFNLNFDQFSFFDIIVYFYVVITNMHKLNSF